MPVGGGLPATGDYKPVEAAPPSVAVEERSPSIAAPVAAIIPIPATASGKRIPGDNSLVFSTLSDTRFLPSGKPADGRKARKTDR